MFEINGTAIGDGNKPYVIAELSANHGGSLQRAKASILAAKRCGANAVKIQTYSPDTMTIDTDKSDFIIKAGLWKGYNLYQLYKEAHTPYEWHASLFEYAKKIGITIFSTPFDETAVDLLEKLKSPAYKIASFEITDIPLIKYVAKKKKPIFISTGMASIEEIGEALNACNDEDNKDILLFHCISNYPAELSDSKLGDIRYLSKFFRVKVGLSDHTISNTASVLAIALGAQAIEKHFKLDNNDCGPDSSFSILPQQLKSLCQECNIAYQAVLSNKLERPSSEKENKKFRRSIYFVNNLKSGELITEKDVKRIRPGNGLDPKYFNDIIGKRVLHDVYRADPVSWSVLSK